VSRLPRPPPLLATTAAPLSLPGRRCAPASRPPRRRSVTSARRSFPTRVRQRWSWRECKTRSSASSVSRPSSRKTRARTRRRRATLQLSLLPLLLTRRARSGTAPSSATCLRRTSARHGLPVPHCPLLPHPQAAAPARRGTRPPGYPPAGVPACPEHPCRSGAREFFFLNPGCLPRRRPRLGPCAGGGRFVTR